MICAISQRRATMRIAIALAAAMISASSIVFAEQARKKPKETAAPQELTELLQQLNKSIAQAQTEKPDGGMMIAMMKLMEGRGKTAGLERMEAELRMIEDRMYRKLEDLYVLKVLPMPGMQASLIDCSGLENDQVKGVVDIAIDARKSLQSERREEERAIQAQKDALVSRAMALGGIGI